MTTRTFWVAAGAIALLGGTACKEGSNPSGNTAVSDRLKVAAASEKQNTRQQEKAQRAADENALAAPATGTQGVPGKGATQTAAGTQTVIGKLHHTSVNELTLDAGGKPTRLMIDDRTAITIDGQKASLAQLQPGSEVRAAYRMDSGEPRAVSLDVTSTKPPEPK